MRGTTVGSPNAQEGLSSSRHQKYIKNPEILEKSPNANSGGHFFSASLSLFCHTAAMSRRPQPHHDRSARRCARCSHSFTLVFIKIACALFVSGFVFAEAIGAASTAGGDDAASAAFSSTISTAVEADGSLSEPTTLPTAGVINGGPNSAAANAMGGSADDGVLVLLDSQLTRQTHSIFFRALRGLQRHHCVETWKSSFSLYSHVFAFLVAHCCFALICHSISCRPDAFRGADAGHRLVYRMSDDATIRLFLDTESAGNVDNAHHSDGSIPSSVGDSIPWIGDQRRRHGRRAFAAVILFAPTADSCAPHLIQFLNLCMRLFIFYP